MLSEDKKNEILNKSKTWFRELAKKHIENTTKLTNPKTFKINPFLIGYLSKYLSGDCSPISVAKALIYPRVLGSSINTSFGSSFQTYITNALSALGSTTSGIDIEFTDPKDNRKKYCQLKAGPNTINKDDVDTIDNHFKRIRNLSRTNNVDLQINDLVIGILYGEKNEISPHYKNLRDNRHYTVLVGQELWERITGDPNFYSDLQKAITKVYTELSGKSQLDNTIAKLAKHKDIIALSKSLTK